MLRPLKEAIVGLWYNAFVPKPNVKVVFIQTTLILFADCSQHPYGILRPLLDPVADVVGVSTSMANCRGCASLRVH